MSGILILMQIALRNLFASFLNIIIGVIILVGTFFFVVGGSLLNNIDESMSRSITGSVAGQIQVYSANSKDEFAIFSNWSRPDIAAMADFSQIKGPLLAVKNVKTIVPMGIDAAYLAYGNTADQALERLRKVYNERLLNGDHSSETDAKIESLKSHVRQMVTVIQSDYNKLSLAGC